MIFSYDVKHKFFDKHLFFVKNWVLFNLVWYVITMKLYCFLFSKCNIFQFRLFGGNTFDISPICLVVKPKHLWKPIFFLTPLKVEWQLFQVHFFTCRMYIFYFFIICCCLQRWIEKFILFSVCINLSKLTNF